MLDDFSKIAGAKVEAELSVANGAEVKATGNAKLSAQALNNVVVEKSDQYKENYTPSTTTNSHLYGQIVTTNATVNVDGTVEATQVDITADAVNRYVSAESSVLNASNVTSNIVGALTANLDASYAVLNSKAEVNVGQSAEINATGSDTVSAGKVVKPALNIKANSSVEAGAGASTALLKVMNVAGTNIIPAAAVTYSQTHNEAAVNIDGTLKSTGGTSVTALADSKVNSEAKATTMDVSENPNLGDVALNITTGDNKSSVTIGKTAQMTELQKDVNIEAKSVNSVITKAEVSTGEKAVVATAINVTDYDSKANVNINGNVSSKDGSLSVNAENVLTDNTVIANNAMGSSAFMKKIVTNIKGSQSLDSLIGENGAKDQLLGGIKKWLANAKYTPQKLKDKLNAPSTPSAPTEPKPWDKLADFMSTGVSVGVAVESNTADVKIGQGVALAAKNDLNITAKSVIEDTQMQITGKSNNYDKDTSNKALVNASVLYGKLDNTATVTVAGGEEAQGSAPATNVTLTGGKVNIAANSSFEYNRINRMVQEVKDACAKVKAAYKGENHADIEAKADALSNAADAFFNYARDNCFSSNGGEQVDFMDLFGGQKYKDFTAACSALTSALGDEAKNIAVGPINVVSAAAAFANPNSYLNFSAGSANGGKSGPGEHEKPATIALAGSAVATDISNNARVLIGKNANIKAGNELAMQAASKQLSTQARAQSTSMLRMILMFIAQPVLWLWVKLQALVRQQRLPILTAIPMRQLVIMAIQLLRRLQLSRAKAAAIAVINWARTQMRTAARKPKSWRILLPKNVQLCSSWCRMLPVCVRAQMMARIIPSRQISSAPRRPLILKALSMQARLRLMLKPAAKLSMLLLPAAYLPAMTVVKLVFLTSWVIS